MKAIKEYVQIYPLEQFPLIKEFYDNIHSFSEEKNTLWESLIQYTLENGFQVVCRLVSLTEDDNLPRQIYEAFISFKYGTEKDWYYIGRDIVKDESEVIKLLEERSDKIFSIEEWNKEDMQKFLIQTLKDIDCVMS